MRETISYEEVLELKKQKNICIVDVRSEGEFESSTIPNAINIPILDNETRKEVGTLYVNGEIEEAKLVGITHASSKLPQMIKMYKDLCANYGEVILFCSRGGMRSESIYSLLKSLRFPVLRLNGGYKAYRHYISEHLEENLGRVRYVTLYGLSGSGKTEILQQLKAKGASILDLEGCANHRGSLLGGIGLTPANSQKMFESLLFEESLHWKEGQIVYTEGESRRVGPVVLPQLLYERIQIDSPILINSPLEYRIKQIHSDYIDGANLEELAKSIAILSKVIDHKRVERMQYSLVNGHSDDVIAELLTTYYDVRYKNNKKEYIAEFTNIDATQCAADILAHFNQQSQK